MADLVPVPALVQTSLSGEDRLRISDLFVENDGESKSLDRLHKSYLVVYRCTEQQPSDLGFAGWMNLYTDALSMLGDIPKYLAVHFFESGGERTIADQARRTFLGRRAIPGLWLQNLLGELGYKEEVVLYYGKRFWSLVFTTTIPEGQLWRIAKSAWNGALLLRLGV